MRTNTFALIVSLLIASSHLCAQKSDVAYLPKKIEFKAKDSNEEQYEEYKFDKELRLTSAKYGRREAGKIFETDYRNVSIKYNKKTGQVESAQVTHAVRNNDPNAEKILDHTLYTYKFTYDESTPHRIDVELSYFNDRKDMRYGDIEINEKGEMESSSVEKTTANYNIEYDERGNLKIFTQGAQSHTFEYGDTTHNGIFKDSNTPKWLFPFLFDNYDSKLLFRINRSTLVDNITKAQEERPDRDDPSKKETVTEEYKYIYNENNYPSGFYAKRTYDTRNNIMEWDGQIRYETIKIKNKK